MRSAACTAGVMALAACAAAPPPPTVADPRTSVRAPPDPPFDWRVLLPAPAGTRLADMPVHLHEALLFREAAAPPADPEHADCHGLDGPAPLLGGRAVGDYLLCFEHDRLARVEASVPLDAAGPDAAALFGRLCVTWQARKAQAAPSPPEETCEGGGEGVEWHARLLREPPNGPTAVVAFMLTASAPATPEVPPAEAVPP